MDDYEWIHTRLKQMIFEKSFKYEEEPVFKLVSGQMSNFYTNCKPVTLHYFGMQLIGHLVFQKIKYDNLDAVGGLTFGADPIAIATAFASDILYQNLHSLSPTFKPVKAFSVRKTLKDHGVPNWIEGDLKLGEKVAIVDDVVTTGSSTIKAIERVRESDFEVKKVVILVDCQEGGIDNIKKYVKDTISIVTIEDLMALRKEKEVKTFYL